MGVEFRKEGHIAYVTINRPEAMNSLDPDALLQLSEAWKEVRENPDIRVSVLTGAGEKSFRTGTDLKKTPPSPECMSAKYLRDGVPQVPDMQMWKPIIAAINGYAIGGGLEIALACDLRLASTNAKFGLSEVKVASIAGMNGVQCLPRAIPEAVAMKMLLTGDFIDAQEAHRVGLVSDLVEPKDLLVVATKYAERIAANAPLSVKATKHSAAMGRDMPLDAAIAFNHLWWGVLRDTEDRKEGFKAYGEKRDPQYQGR